jgi:predicted RNase H-like HicB family nuclease
MQTKGELTQYFMSQGYDLMEARKKTEEKIKFMKEVGQINTEEIPKVTL